jgi:uncharacterized membrane protein
VTNQKTFIWIIRWDRHFWHPKRFDQQPTVLIGMPVRLCPLHTQEPAMKSPKPLFPILCFSLTLILQFTAEAQTAKDQLQFVSIDFPGSVSTVANGINTRGEIVGTYLNVVSATDHHGFLLTDGKFRTIDVPAGTLGTDLFGINDGGAMVGEFFDAQNHGHGFAGANGTFAQIDFPNASETAAIGINDSGLIVGAYINPAGDQHGFLLSHGRLSTIDVPGALETVARGISDSGEIVGFFFDAEVRLHGFVLSKGIFRTVDVPGGSIAVLGVNSVGTLVGDFTTGAKGSAFLLREGVFHTIDIPGATGSSAQGINAGGGIVGTYLDSNFTFHGFFAVAPR